MYDHRPRSDVAGLIGDETQQGAPASHGAIDVAGGHPVRPGHDPVKLYLATESSSIGFNLLHASCLNRIQMKIYCPYHDEVIPRSETVRGYEYTKGKYVVVSDEDIDSVPLKTVRAIEIELFTTPDGTTRARSS